MSSTKILAILTTALTVVSAAEPAFAQAGLGRGNGAYRDGYDQGYREAYRDGYSAGYQDGLNNRNFSGDRYGPPPAGFGPPPQQGFGQAPPPPNTTVVVVNPREREQRWRQRYARTYSFNDDTFYQECRQSVDPAGVIAGALIGGLLGNAVGRGGGRGGATVAGVVVGGALGAALTRNLECEDRSYAYRTYYDGFNAGQPNRAYQWRNPENGHYGTFRVGDYYNDPDGFRCATYAQQIFVNGRPQAATGRACQQPDGTWAIVG